MERTRALYLKPKLKKNTSWFCAKATFWWYLQQDAKQELINPNLTFSPLWPKQIWNLIILNFLYSFRLNLSALESSFRKRSGFNDHAFLKYAILLNVSTAITNLHFALKLDLMFGEILNHSTVLLCLFKFRHKAKS